MRWTGWGARPAEARISATIPNALKKAMKSNLLAKAFECPVDKEVYQQLMDALSEGADAPEAKQ